VRVVLDDSSSDADSEGMDSSSSSNQGSMSYAAKIVGTDALHDLAVLQVTGSLLVLQRQHTAAAGPGRLLPAGLLWSCCSKGAGHLLLRLQAAVYISKSSLHQLPTFTLQACARCEMFVHLHAEAWRRDTRHHTIVSDVDLCYSNQRSRSAAVPLSKHHTRCTAD